MAAAGGGGAAAGAGGSEGVVVSGGLLGSREDVDDDAPSELLAPLLEEWRDVFVMEVLARLDPTDCAMIALVARPWLAVVVASGSPRAGTGGGRGAAQARGLHRVRRDVGLGEI